MKIYGFCSLFIIANSLTVLGAGRSCIWSLKSLEEVRSCPVTKEKWEERERKKNCESLARVQNCTTDASKFKYHCVINELENGFVEVCAPVYNINGHCAEYNKLGQRIQLHNNLKCSDVKPPCADQYPSTEAYLYKGCYDIVENYLLEFSTNDKNVSIKDPRGIESNITVGNVTTNNGLGTGETISIIYGIIVVIFFTGGIVHICVRYFRKRNMCSGKLEKNGDEENVQLEPLMQTTDQSESTSDKKFSSQEECKNDYFQYDIECGKLLRELARNSETPTNEKFENVKADSKALFEAYDTILKKYVETKLTYTCTQQLEQAGVLILSGIQGSGKTLTAIHIMNKYEGWTKLKFTSCEDLLAFDINAKTVILIDNIFDGFMYSHPLLKWWHSLCYFYFEYIWKQNDIRLIITAKNGVIEKACAHLKAHVPVLDKSFYVKAELVTLTQSEKIDILTRHFELAEERNISRPFLSTELKACIKNHTGPIGFPLCAYLYAFEDRNEERDFGIFNDTVAYVRKQIAHTIKTDESYRVKTLLLILLFYQSPPGSNCVLDLKYREDCNEFLQQDCFKEWLDKMKPLQTENLYEIAKDLERKLLLKHLTMHEVYLNGVRDYFMRKHWEVAVPHFPLDILRTDEFKAISVECLEKLVERFKKEILQYVISKTLSAKIFGDPSFERKFCEELHREKIFEKILLFPDIASEYKLPVIFWANKYKLNILSKMLWDLIEKNKPGDDFQFYLARFGECCENDENYITCTSSPLDLSNLKKIVCHFRTSEQKTVLHLLVSSEKSDYDAHRFLRKILKDIPDLAKTVDTNLFQYALNHSKSSRLLCILEILNLLKFETDFRKNESIPCEVDPENKAFWELEWIVRICIVWAYNEKERTKRIDFHSFNKDQRHLQTLLDGSWKKETDMARIIKYCTEKCEKSSPSPSRNILKMRDVPFRKGFTSEFKKTIFTSIQEQFKKEAYS